MEENNQQNIPLLCRKNCGFFGSPNFDGLCSKCHRSAQAQLTVQPTDRITSALESRLSIPEIRKSPELTERHSKKGSISPDPERKLPLNSSRSRSSASVSIDTPSSESPSQAELQADDEVANTGLSDLLLDERKSDSNRSSPVSSKPLRCDFCRKRVGLVGGYTCRCGKMFCSAHRYSDTHNCSFDYREAGQEDIRRSNPQIVCSKLAKI